MSDPISSQEKISSLSASIADTLNEVLHEARPTLARMVHQVGGNMHDMALQGKDAALHAEHQLEKEAHRARVTAEHDIQNAPFKSVLIAAGTGAATALAVSWLMHLRKH